MILGQYKVVILKITLEQNVSFKTTKTIQQYVRKFCITLLKFLFLILLMCLVIDSFFIVLLNDKIWLQKC